MSAYLVVDITVHDPEMYKEYAREVPPFIEKYGGVYHVRAFLEDPGYRPVAAIRHEAATTNMVIADGL
jgi:uncharacterized protein (DUF1330 family)